MMEVLATAVTIHASVIDWILIALIALGINQLRPNLPTTVVFWVCVVAIVFNLGTAQ